MPRTAHRPLRTLETVPAAAARPETPLLPDRDKLKAETLAFVAEADEYDLEKLVLFATILQRNCGCTTPVEEFVANIVSSYGHAERKGRGLTVKDVECAVKELDEDLRQAIQLGHRFARLYPAPEKE